MIEYWDSQLIYRNYHKVTMSAPFDVHDRNSYYFGSMSRKEATDILMNERECGVFLVRDSSTIIGDFVLSVKEVISVSFVFEFLATI